VLITKYSGAKIKEKEMGKICGLWGGRGEAYTGFWWENLREKDHFEDLLCVRMILYRVFKK
jgi:hypothetical protein